MKVAYHPDNFDGLVPHGDPTTNGIPDAHEPDGGFIEDNARAIRWVGRRKVASILDGHAQRVDHAEVSRNDLELGTIIRVLARPNDAVGAAVMPGQAMTHTGSTGDAGDLSCFGEECVLLLHI